MIQTVDYAAWAAMLRHAAKQIKENHEILSRLDSFGGDGDHGTTMTRAMGILEKAVEGDASNSVKTMLYDVGWAIMGVDGGATGPLFGSFFMAMSEAVGEGDGDSAEPAQPLDTAALAVAFEAGLAGVQKNSRAKVGDKTLIDALVPAVKALRQGAEQGIGLVPALEKAAGAAREGAASTCALQARFGRAKNVGEKSIGEEDPGAASVAFIFKGFLEGVKSRA